MACWFEVARSVIAGLLVLAFCGGVAAQALSPRAALAPSPVIAEIKWAPLDTIVRQAKGGDNWPVTWADDNAIYSTYGDGYGFKPKLDEKLSLGFVRVTGDADHFAGTNVRSPDEQYGQGRAGKKGWGMLCVEGRLYLWLGHADQKGGQAQLAWSDDHAQTWTFADWKFPAFGLMGFVNFGRDYDGARDGFVYAYSHDGPLADTPADGFVLMRAPQNELVNRDAWEFFERWDASGKPTWTADVDRRGHVVRREGASLRSAMTYNAGLGRYLWWQQTPRPLDAADRGDTRFEGGFVVLDASEPWGPWTVAYQTDRWDVGPGEHADFPAKWISHDGRAAYLIFSGDDFFSVRRAQIQPRESVNKRSGE
jgi:hypothetical protein